MIIQGSKPGALLEGLVSVNLTSAAAAAAQQHAVSVACQPCYRGSLGHEPK